MLSGVTNLMSFLGFINIGSLFPLMIRITILYTLEFNQANISHTSIMLRILGILFGTILPAILIIMLSYVIPFIATFVLVIITTSYMIAYVLILLIKNYKPSYPLYYVFVNLLDKCLILCYLFGMKNSYGIEY